MNREIKFRAWDKKNKEWVKPIDGVIGITELGLEQPIDLEVNQYTNLKDKNGTEIYEGDIVRITDEEDAGQKFKALNIVKWNKEDGGWGVWEQWVGDNNMYEDQWHEDIYELSEMNIDDFDLKVISNIYQNKLK